MTASKQPSHEVGGAPAELGQELCLSFSVPGRPARWQRTTSATGTRRTPEAMRDAKRAIRNCGAAAKTNLGAWPTDGAYAVELTFVRCRKATLTPDVDNYQKLVLDALNGVLWDDDAQVVELHGAKVQAASPSEERTVVRVEVLP